MKYLKLIRINNWVKNLFIFIPLFFSSDLLNLDKFILTLFGSLGFSLVTSFVYIINDIFDIDFDKNHPDKKNRPIPSGIISIRKSLIDWVIFIYSWINHFMVYFISFFPNNNLLFYS